MNEERIGVFVCHCGLNIAGTVDVEKVTEELSKYPGVAYATDYRYVCSDPGQNLIKEAVKEHNLTKFVVAACTPSLHERTFRRVGENAGLNPYLVEIANIREQCSWVHTDKDKATEKAIRIIKYVVEKLKLNRPLEPSRIPITKKALVIGGGIAGIQAALDIADAGYEVLIVERMPSIGGHMAQLSETFPTLDCSQCILTPKMVDVGHHPKIKLMTLSEIDEVSGYVGNFKVKIRKKVRYVDIDKCTACGECEKVCPVEVPSWFEVGLAKRKAIYRPFPQAVPSAYSITRLGMPPCQAACPIHQNAQGYVTLIREGKYKEALEVILRDHPLPSICGRVCTRPCETSCTRKDVDEPVAIHSLKRFVTDMFPNFKLEGPKDEKDKRIAIVGAGPAGLACAYELRKRGYKVTIYDVLPYPGGMMYVGIPEFRLPKKLLLRDIKRIEDVGVEFKLKVQVGKDVTLDELKEKYDALFIAIGAHIERKMGIEGEDLDGVWGGVEFLRSINLGKKVKIGKRVCVVGGGNSAVDAARVALRLGAKEVTIVYRRSRVEMPADPKEVDETEAEGVKILFLTLPTKAIGDGKIREIECLRMELGPPDESGRRRPIPIEGSEFRIPCDTLIITIGQEPDINSLKDKLGLKLTRWKTFEVDPVTMQTNIPGVFAGGDCVRGPDVIIDAILDGKKAAESIARYLEGRDMKEEREEPFKSDVKLDTKGIPKKPRVKMRKIDIDKRISWKEVELGFNEEEAREEASRCLDCAVCCDCRLCTQACEPKAIDHFMKDEIIEEEFGAIIVATGYETMPKEQIGEYGAGRIKDVIDGLQFERLLSASGPTGGIVKRPSDESIPKEVVFIQCVGSRDEKKYPYCSKICCMYTAKHAMLYKHRIPDGQAYVFFMDVRTGGKGYEEFWKRAVEEDGVVYLRGKVSTIYEENGKVVVCGFDTLTGKQIRISADLVVLAMAIRPSPGIEELASKLGLCPDEFGFLQEAHPKLRPVETVSSGIFLAGVCQGPKDIPEVVAQASGAASKVIAMFSQDEYIREPIIADVDEELCSGCRVCIGVCPYNAREYDEEKGIVKVIEALCEGCGACASTCPSGATSVKNYTDEQVFRMVTTALEGGGK